MNLATKPNAISRAFAEFDADSAKVLDQLRELILTQAQVLSVEVDECLRWGQPSYISPVGSMLRLGISKSGHPAIFAHCQTTIIADFAAEFGSDFQIEGNRAITFPTPDAVQADKLCLMIAHALRYKITKP